MLFRFGWGLALSCLLILANQQEVATDCCPSDSEKVSPKRVKALLQKTELIHSPCCADTLHIKGTVVLALAVDDNGNVICVATISGHPLIISTTIESVRQWKFRPYVVRGPRKGFCGRVAIKYQANEHAMKYRVIEAPLGSK
jgi:outer membrane biosynthesis protein TonB